jgi:ketosteroid isomerase-like protein
MREESKTPDLVELVQQAIGAADRKDWDAIESLLAPDVVWESLDGVGVFEGPTAVRGFVEDFQGGYESFHTEPQEILDLGHGIAFAMIRHTGRLRGGAGDVEGRYAWAVASDQGRVVQVIAGSDIARCRAAAERLAEERA